MRISSRNLRYLGPNWYAVVMGTAIVANAGAALPSVPGSRIAYEAVWALSAVALVVLLAARAAHWARHRDQARAHLLDPAVAPFYGCVSMALLAVGGGTLSVGADVIGVRAAVAVDAVLWTAGTVIGLAAAAGIPYLMITRHRIGAQDASPVWLLPVVPPMVAAALGPALAAHVPAGQGRLALLLGCYALFGLSLMAVLLILPAVFLRLVRHGAPAPALTPTLFLVLGPLGQSVTAAAHLAEAAPAGVHGGYFAVAYGVPVLGFALLWLALAGALAVRALRRGMPFAMTWWGFTFPLGTCVTGAAGLARPTGLHALTWLAVGLYAVLVGAWSVVAVRTALGVARGTLLAPPNAGPAAPPVGAGAASAAPTPGAGAAAPPAVARGALAAAPASVPGLAAAPAPSSVPGLAAAPAPARVSVPSAARR
ncbi:TDT family transporter [Streptomyces sp. XD-27]|uniref:TDT family transporter n=1 Tax=Streptomyces sp. XD-27 TaxID=3062779 RepID=UPI0026F40C38|nr:TDT family transporter [Streptomyces sp. XD-27]WKX69422.1 TDT family transporter [Streptomyces sp. XD-27]